MKSGSTDQGQPSAATRRHACSTAEAVDAADARPASRLDPQQAGRRLAQYGRNGSPAQPLQQAFQTTAHVGSPSLSIALPGAGKFLAGEAGKSRAAALAAVLDVNSPLRVGPGMRAP